MEEWCDLNCRLTTNPCDDSRSLTLRKTQLRTEYREDGCFTHPVDDLNQVAAGHRPTDAAVGLLMAAAVPLARDSQILHTQNYDINNSLRDLLVFHL